MPVIMVISYLITEIFKTFINKKYLPIVAGISGGVLGILSFLLQIDSMPATDIMSALAIGIASGLAATGTNQIIKQLKGKEDERDKK